MSRSLIETWLNHDITFNQGYGMTETAIAITALRTEDALRKFGSCGKPVFHTDIRVVDMGGQELPRGKMGEVWVKGPSSYASTGGCRRLLRSSLPTAGCIAGTWAI